MANQIKYFYNGKLIRTSTHVYTHAVLNLDGECIACRNGYENAVSAQNAEKRRSNLYIKNAKEAVKMLKAGRNCYYPRIGGSSHKYTFTNEDTIEKYEDTIKRCEEYNKMVDSYLIVELEAK